MKAKFFLILTILLLFLGAKYFGLSDYLSLEYLKSQREFLSMKVHENFLFMYTGYFFLYVLATGLSLPGAAVLTLGAGAIFGLWYGVVMVSFASTFGACFSFSLARIFRNWFEKKFENFFSEVNSRIKKEGWVYLLSLRIMPIFPFFLVNILMGLTSISILEFYIVSQLGMLPATIIYVNAGTQISQIQQMSDLFTTKFLLSFVLIGIFPLVAKRIFDLRRKHV